MYLSYTGRVLAEHHFVHPAPSPGRRSHDPGSTRTPLRHPATTAPRVRRPAPPAPRSVTPPPPPPANDAPMTTPVPGIASSTQATKAPLVDAATGEVLEERRAPHPDGTEADPRARRPAV